MDLKHVKVAGTGTYLPGDPVHISEIHEYLGYLPNASTKIDKWIRTTHEIMKEILGIEYYYYAFDKITREFRDDVVSMAVKSAKKAMAEVDMKPSEIDLLIYGGGFSHQIPPISAIIQEELEIVSCSEMHIHSNCTSIYKAIQVAFDSLRIGRYKNALVISSNIPSSLLRMEYYNQQAVKKEDLFLRWYLCDGAGAMLLVAQEKRDKGCFLENTYIESVGGNKPAAMGFRHKYYWENPLTTYNATEHHFYQQYQNELTRNFMEGGESLFYAGLKRMIAKYTIDISKMKYYLINMPTKYIVNQIMNESQKLGIRKDQVYTAMSEMGYCGPPAVLVSLDRLLKNETLSDGDLILSFVTEASKFLQAGFTIGYTS